MLARRSVVSCVRARWNSNLATTEKTQVPAQQDQDEIIPVDPINGFPEDIHKRIVRIYKPAKTNMQSGIQGTKLWRLDWDTLEKDNRWTNPLMGWASSGDYMQGTALKFASAEDAIRFAEKQGWNYFLQAPHKQEFHPKSYSSNFTRTQMNPKKIAHTK